MDYAYLLGFATSKWDTILQSDISYYNKDTVSFFSELTNSYWRMELTIIQGSIEIWPVSKFEETFGVKWGQYYRCTNDYIFELLFSGFSIGEKDMKFRHKYFPIMEKTSGDDNLILAKISDEVCSQSNNKQKRVFTQNRLDMVSMLPRHLTRMISL